MFSAKEKNRKHTVINIW